jgi:hypothetical protein
MLETCIPLDAAAVLRVRFLDYQFDLLLAELDLPHRASDEQIKTAVATVLDLPVCGLRHFVVDRAEDGSLTLRSEQR